MQRRLTSLAAALIVLPTFAFGCEYCGMWTPTASTYGARYERQVVSSVGVYSVSLPYCMPAMVEPLELVDRVQGVYWSTDGKGQPQTAVYRIAAAPFCKVVHLGLAQDSRLKLNVWSRAIAGWEELRISVYPSKSSVDDIIHGGEFLEYLSPQPGQQRRVRYRPTPMPAAAWWFVRDGHNPCDEGFRRSEILCNGWRKP